MGHRQAIRLLPYQIRRLAAQDDPRSPRMSLAFVEGGFDFASARDRAPPVRQPAPVRGRGSLLQNGTAVRPPSIPSRGYSITRTMTPPVARRLTFSEAYTRLRYDPSGKRFSQGSGIFFFDPPQQGRAGSRRLLPHRDHNIPLPGLGNTADLRVFLRKPCRSAFRSPAKE